MRILVCGGRNFGDLEFYKRSDEEWDQKEKEYKFIMKELNTIVNHYSKNYKEDDNWLPTDITIISGAARGVDSVAIDYAVVHYCQLKEFPADWKKYGKTAGPIRNQQMLDEGKPDLVVAFPGGTGTADMVRRAKKAGIEVKEINDITIS